MPDITMCCNYKCKIRDTCYRATAKPDNYQSYSDFKGVCDGNNGWFYYIKIMKRDELDYER